MPRVEVAIPGSAYDILVEREALRQIGPEMRALGLTGKVALVTHPEIPPIHSAATHGSLENAGFSVEMAFVPQGEASKSLAALESLYHRFASMRLDRQSCVVALGGGVIGDLAGFAAATYLRGVALVQAPTTLLSQVDSSVGGKTGIDLPAGKNLVGAFHQPRLVIADIDTLGTLPSAEIRSGIAEVVKYGVIWDADLFTSLERDVDRILAGDAETMTRLVVRSCEIKAEVVRQDPHEHGLRAILNYGHTVGHALEATWGYGVVPHGFAVALGMSAAARLSMRLGLLDQETAVRQDRLLARLGLPVLPPSLAEPHVSDSGPASETPLPDIAKLIGAMALDKKALAGRLRFVLARAIGAVEVREVAAEEVAAVLECSD